MQTATIIILSFSVVILLAVVIMQHRELARRDNIVENIKKSIQEYETQLWQRKVEIAEAKARRAAFAVAGDTMHRVSYIFENGIPKHAALIERLGQYARSMYLSSETPLEELERKSNNWEDVIQFPELTDEQNAKLTSFLQKINKGKIRPEAILDLMENLLCGYDFEKAVKTSEYMFSEKAEQ